MCAIASCLAVVAQSPAQYLRARRLADVLDVPLLPSASPASPRKADIEPMVTSPLYLLVSEQRLELRQQGMGAISVDFVNGPFGFRRRQQGFLKQLLARAVGVKAGKRPSVLDATAGLGRDGFLLACTGCTVLLLEKHPVIAALLDDGLQRARADARTAKIVKDRLALRQIDAVEFMSASENENAFDVVYLDPMYPHYKSTANVKKEMQLFRRLLGVDEKTQRLLGAALKCAKDRVVVKRPRRGETIEGLSPSFSMEGKSTRYDIYLTHLA